MANSRRRLSSRSRATKSEKQKAIVPSKVLETIEQHVLLDGFKVVVDLDKSRGSYLYNAVSDKQLIDLYGFSILCAGAKPERSACVSLAGAWIASREARATLTV